MMSGAARISLNVRLRTKLRPRGAGIAPEDVLARATGRVTAQVRARHRSTVGLCPGGAPTPEPGRWSPGPREPTQDQIQRTC